MTYHSNGRSLLATRREMLHINLRRLVAEINLLGEYLDRGDYRGSKSGGISKLHKLILQHEEAFTAIKVINLMLNDRNYPLSKRLSQKAQKYTP